MLSTTRNSGTPNRPHAFLSLMLYCKNKNTHKHTSHYVEKAEALFYPFFSTEERFCLVIVEQFFPPKSRAVKTLGRLMQERQKKCERETGRQAELFYFCYSLLIKQVFYSSLSCYMWIGSGIKRTASAARISHSLTLFRTHAYISVLFYVSVCVCGCIWTCLGMQQQHQR